MKALLFGSIGVFCDSSELQRQAFNQAFAEAGLDWYWDAPLYQKLLLSPGGLARVTRFAREYDAESAIDFASIHKRKTKLFADMLEDQQQTIRSGVIRLIRSARDKGIKVGWVTGTEYSTLEVIIHRSEGMLSMSDFDIITHRNTPVKQKPDPSPYLNALTQLRIEADQAIAIEDTAACMRSAIRADIACIITPHKYSMDQDYYEATAVVSSLGDPASPARMIDGVSLVDQHGLVTTDSLHNLVQSMVYS